MIATAAMLAATSAWAQTVTPNQPATGAGTTGQNVVAPPAEALVPGATSTSGAANVVLPPAESLTRGGGQTVLPPAENLTTGQAGGFPATAGAGGAGTAGTPATATGTGTTGTGTAATGTLTSTGLTVPPAITPSQAAQTALQTGGLAPLVTETGVGATTQVAFFGDGSQQPQRRGTGGGALGATAVAPIGTSPGSRPGAPQYIGAETTPYDPDQPDALDFSRTP